MKNIKITIELDGSHLQEMLDGEIKGSCVAKVHWCLEEEKKEDKDND